MFVEIFEEYYKLENYLDDAETSNKVNSEDFSIGSQQ